MEEGREALPRFLPLQTRPEQRGPGVRGERGPPPGRTGPSPAGATHGQGRVCWPSSEGLGGSCCGGFAGGGGFCSRWPPPAPRTRRSLQLATAGAPHHADVRAHLWGAGRLGRPVDSSSPAPRPLQVPWPCSSPSSQPICLRHSLRVADRVPSPAKGGPSCAPRSPRPTLRAVMSHLSSPQDGAPRRAARPCSRQVTPCPPAADSPASGVCQAWAGLSSVQQEGKLTSQLP